MQLNLHYAPCTHAHSFLSALSPGSPAVMEVESLYFGSPTLAPVPEFDVDSPYTHPDEFNLEQLLSEGGGFTRRAMSSARGLRAYIRA